MVLTFPVPVSEGVCFWGRDGGEGRTVTQSQGGVALSSEAAAFSEQACSPYRLEEATRVIKSIILWSIVLARGRESSGEEQTECALSPTSL